MDDVFFLAGVIVVWCLVGRALDRRGTPRSVARGGVLIALFAFILGCLLFFVGMHDLGPSRPDNLGSAVGAVLTLIWSVSLIVIAGRALTKVIRRCCHRHA
jgi:hypothetical protein